MTPEDEEFNRIERESHIKKEYIRAMRKKVGDDFDAEYAKTMTGLMDDIALARMLIRELGDRLARIEAGHMRNDVIEEVAKEIEKFTAFGQDTVQSFAVYIRGMKT